MNFNPQAIITHNININIVFLFRSLFVKYIYTIIKNNDAALVYGIPYVDNLSITGLGIFNILFIIFTINIINNNPIINPLISISIYIILYIDFFTCIIIIYKHTLRMHFFVQEFVFRFKI